MPKYLTPSMYYLMDDSVPDAGSIAPAVLARTISRAEGLIDTYCGFDSRFGGFESHTASFQGAFDERSLRIRIPNFPVPVRKVTRYRIQVSNQSDGTGFFANISTADTVINYMAGYVEIVPLQAVTYSMVPFMIGLGLRPPLIQIDYEAGFYLPAFGETLENNSSDLQTYLALRGFWATSYDLVSFLQPLQVPAVPPVIYVNGVAQATTGVYTLDTTEGIVRFNTPLSAGSVVTADYTYTIPDAVTQATSAQVTWMLQQRNLSLQGLGGIEVARSRDQQIKRHIRTSSGNSNKDEPAISAESMQLLEPYTYIPVA